MNFQTLKKIEKADFYLDVAFRRAGKKVNETKVKNKDRVIRAKILEQTRLEMIRVSLTNDLNKIIKSFPSIDNLDIFYKELIKCTLDYKSLKKSLGSINWAIKKINEFSKFYSKKINRINDYKLVFKLRKEYYGRISSVLKQIKKHLNYLEESRKTMKGYPAIKTGLFTVCLFGFPNVGKSTILSKITDASPEIKEYAFTTKKLNLGYIKEPIKKIQVIDTPGTLNRPDKMNYIELQAYLAVKYLTNLIVFVFDPTYDLRKQKALLNNVKKYDKKVIIYLSKTDIAEKQVINKFKSAIKDPIILKEQLIKLVKSNRA